MPRLTPARIESAMMVLEELREDFHEDGMESEAETMNEAHYLVQEYDANRYD